MKRERERECEREKRESGVVVSDNTYGGEGRNYISGFEGSQAVSARPSDIYDVGMAVL
jgi:hypothetical protein